MKNWTPYIPKGIFSRSRRHFLRSLAGSAVLIGFERLARSLPAPSYAFDEVPADVSGIHWVHSSGKSVERYLPETTGAGCAFVDYDNDGWMDIYLVNSGKCDFFDPNPPLHNALYRNNRDGTFTDVTEKAGVRGGGYGQGVAVGDYDGDSFPDLYVTQYGRNILYHNNGDGTFTDVTEKLGIDAESYYGLGVLWLDYDKDGCLDLYVANDSSPSLLYHNNCHGGFTEIGAEAGVAYS